jgi:hypothetical protein
MAQWERLAPYNAAQAMTVAGRFSREQVESAWREAIESLGVRDISCDGVGDTQDVVATINADLNANVAPRALKPALRSDDATTLLLTYRHLVADSASIRLVMRQWYACLVGDSSLRFDRAVTSMRGDGSLLGTLLRNPIATAREASREFARWRAMKRVARVQQSKLDLRAPVVHERRDLPAGSIARLLQAARHRNAKVNDLFVAAGAIACAEHLPMEHAHKRPDIAFGTIVDTRTHAPLDAFGLSLGFLQTIFPDGALRDGSLRDVERAIAIARDAAARARVLSDAKSSDLRLAFAERFCRKHSPIEMADFYRKRCPLVGGVSNVNLNADWPGRADPTTLLDYTRISPLGPMISVVFTPSTLGERLHYGFTWRSGLIDAATARAIAERFEEILFNLV